MNRNRAAVGRGVTTSTSSAAVFDQWANSYDEVFTKHRAGVWLRESVHRAIRPLLSENSRVLELGCGTGEDAIWFASEGHAVLATDSASAMLDVARRKVAGRNLDVAFEELDLNRCAESLIPGIRPFDVVFANFGVLNCVPDLKSLFSMCARSATPDALFCAVVMGRFCAWESLWYGLRWRWRDATRRWRGRAVVREGSAEFAVHYYGPRALKSAAGAEFVPIALVPIGIVLPPSYLFRYQNRWPRVFRTLYRLERIAQRFSLFAFAADHYLLAMRRSSV